MMIKNIVLIFYLIILQLVLAASPLTEGNPTISGTITDAASGEGLIGATVVVEELGQGTATNYYGYYSLSLKPGKYTLKVSYIGYNSISKSISLTSNTVLNLSMEEITETIEEVVISTDRPDKNIASTEMSVTKLPMKTVKKIPLLFGEVDVIKSIQLLPGVQTVGEGSTGFYVRGGAVDQNLILLDNATVYNPSHFAGFFSVFNGDAIKNVELYKGGIPAEYGGRLSSVLDIRMKEGNSQKYTLTGGIGVIASRLTLEGPIVKNKGSFIISGRRTYADMFLPIFAKDSLAKESKGYFYDFNAKANYKINDNNTIFASGYFGRDLVELGDIFGMDYGNATGTLRWNHLFSPKLFSNTTLIYSQYNYNLIVSQDPMSFKWLSNIIDYSFKNEYTYYLNPSNTIKFGLQSTYHTLKPGKVETNGESFISIPELPQSHALESAIFVQNDQKITEKLSIKYGLRFSMFQNIGSTTFIHFDENHMPVDSVGVKYAKGEIYNTYSGLQPRLGMRYKLNDKSSVKASYNRMYQYIHLGTNSTASTPLDIWFPSNPNIKPQMADQVAIGYFRNFMDNMFETSVEVYYKKMENAIDFKDHAELTLNRYLDGEMRIGEATAYGAEFLVRKQSGKFTGWVSYTLSSVKRKIPEINGGKAYSAPYDKPHDLSVVFSYDYTKRLNFSINWVYSSALPVTVPTGKMYYGNAVVPVYSDRNSYRIPGTAYHRMDASVTYDLVSTGRFEHNLNFSIYNLYNRHNTYSISFNEGGEQATKYYLFKVVPAITYNFKF